ncbi:hypothetical protein BABINDRAFT_161898 [Babjeviella inositovora NRRL Y-12698]|uniref:Histone-lysine N-methyltransferase SET5 n=1 Tax=Babjeviella inositovora NRRL Y-12698 TaxID=984486 RepID=A0A1E3QP82_9ASCO|nr:uncharacterized protein BABINDRAFT_161898 [Babjeviella inositovora NRRL Y-12698]ODQ79503.1 hypothetical protein BABINDRAFT_161898 [Babjeviella inositovora NRRL Y-12698]
MPAELPKIEILTINDKDTAPESTAPVNPHERQVIDEVIKIWKQDSATESLGALKLHVLVKKAHPNWTLSEKRFKTVMKNQGLLTTSNQYCYANEIQSSVTPDLVLPELVRLQSTKRSGKGLYATKPIPEGALLWEETQLFFVPPLANVNLVRAGKACTHCSRALHTRSNASGVQILSGLDCNTCPEMWCSLDCKKADKTHAQTKHSVYNPSASSKKVYVDSIAWDKFEKYCSEQSWTALYGVGHVHAQIVLDKTGLKAQQFAAMARVSQAIRYKALDSTSGSFDSASGGALFAGEQQEILWKEGLVKLNACFPGRPLEYDEYLHYLGTYNINNIDNSLFLTQSHLNHNCNPNVTVKWGTKRTDGIKVYAKRAIKTGEELTTTYISPTHSVAQRKRELRVNWGFMCACNKCKEDEKATQRRKSSAGAMKGESKEEIRKMLDKSKEAGETEIELGIPDEFPTGRRKSVRFDEKVTALSK